MKTKTHKQKHPPLAELASKLGVSVQDILSHCRKAELVDARSMIVAILLEHTSMRQQDIAPLLDISQAAVSKLLARHNSMMGYAWGHDYKARFEQLEKDIAASESIGNTNHKTQNL